MKPCKMNLLLNTAGNSGFFRDLADYHWSKDYWCRTTVLSSEFTLHTTLEGQNL